MNTYTSIIFKVKTQNDLFVVSLSFQLLVYGNLRHQWVQEKKEKLYLVMEERSD